jgi:hypothetical protein
MALPTGKCTFHRRSTWEKLHPKYLLQYPISDPWHGWQETPSTGGICSCAFNGREYFRCHPDILQDLKHLKMAGKQCPEVTLDSLPGPALELVVKRVGPCRVKKLLLRTSRALRDTVLAVTTGAQLCLDKNQRPADMAANQALLRRLCKLASPGLQLELKATGGSFTLASNRRQSHSHLLEQLLKPFKTDGLPTVQELTLHVSYSTASFCLLLP